MASTAGDAPARLQTSRVIVVSFPEAATPAEVRRQIRELQDQAWTALDTGDGAAAATPVHDPALLPQTMALVEGDVVVAALDILTKDVDHAGHRFRAGGLSTVVTRVDRRRHGYGHRLVRHAREVMAQTGHDLGIFTCDRPLRRFYERAGWEHLPGTVLVGGTRESPFPSDQAAFDKVTMGAFFSTPARRARRTFDGARVELYPGTIDKLW